MARPLDGIGLLTYFRRLKLSKEAQKLVTEIRNSPPSRTPGARRGKPRWPKGAASESSPIRLPSANPCPNARSAVSLGIAKEFCAAHYPVDLVESGAAISTPGQPSTILSSYLSPSLPYRLSPLRLGAASDCPVCRPSQSGHYTFVYPSFGTGPGGATHPRNESHPRLACANPGAYFP